MDEDIAKREENGNGIHTILQWIEYKTNVLQNPGYLLLLNTVVATSGDGNIMTYTWYCANECATHIILIFPGVTQGLSVCLCQTNR